VVSANVYYDREHYHGTYIYGTGADRFKNEDIAESNWLGSELRARWAVPGLNLLTLGSEYSYHPAARQQNYDLPTHAIFLDDERSFDNWGTYWQDELTLLPHLTIVGGLRYDHAYSNRIKRTSPRVAMIWNPLASTNIKLLYGEAFRPPSLYEQYYAAGALE